jgi:hypothetical protein
MDEETAAAAEVTEETVDTEDARIITTEDHLQGAGITIALHRRRNIELSWKIYRAEFLGRT